MNLMPLKLTYRQIEKKIDNLEVRERMLFCATACVVLVVLVNAVFIEKMLTRYKEHIKQIESTSIELEASQAAIMAMEKFSIEDPNEALRFEKQQLVEKIKSLDGEFNKLQKDLIQADEMLEILNYILGVEAGLNVVSVKTIPPKAVEGRRNTALNLPKLYKHGISLKFQGTFFQAKKYVENIENLGKKIYWEEISYLVTGYPEGKLKISLDVISTSEDMFGNYDFSHGRPETLL